MLRLARGGQLAPEASVTPLPDNAAPMTQTVGADGEWEPITVPSGRWGHTAIYDPTRDRMVIFGGASGYNGGLRNDVLVLSLSGTPTWSALEPTGTPPTPRSGCTAVYDATNNRMVVFGGYVPDYETGALQLFNDVWALSLGTNPEWTQIMPAGNPPGGRWGHTAIYDPVRERMVVFGGAGSGAIAGSDLLNDTWALSLGSSPEWTEIAPSGSPPGCRASGTAVYDPRRDRMVTYGGAGYRYVGEDYPKPTFRDYLNDVWVLSLGASPTWSEFTPAGTGDQRGLKWHTATYDPVGDRMVVFGGFDDSASDPNVNAVKWLSLAGTPHWDYLAVSESEPSTRLGHTAIYDPVRNRMVTFGGLHSPGQFTQVLDDIWSLSLGSQVAWTPVIAQGVAPLGRHGQSALYDPRHRRMLVFGGQARGEQEWDPACLDDVWALSLEHPSVWNQVTVAGTLPDCGYRRSTIYDGRRDRVLACYVTPNDRGDFSLELWALQLGEAPTWTRLLLGGTAPAAWDFYPILDPSRDRLLVFGSGGDYFHDIVKVWEAPLSGNPEWEYVEPAGTVPSGRSDQAVVYDPVRDRVVMFGGWRYDGQDLGGVWTLSLSGVPEWAHRASLGAPPTATSWTSATYDPLRDRIVVPSQGTYSRSTWTLSLGEDFEWTELHPAGATPWGRGGQGAIYDPGCDRIVVFGGSEGYADLNDVWTLKWGTCNRPPDVSAATASEALMAARDHSFRAISILGVTDPDGDPVTITATAVTQDEPVNGSGDGATCPDAQILQGQASVRAERCGSGNGRVYAVSFAADDGRGGRSDGVVNVCVPHDQGDATCADDGQKYNSTAPCLRHVQLHPQEARLEVDPIRGSQAAIHFELPARGEAEVAVFDLAGRRLATLERGELLAGAYDRSWQLNGVPKGLYFVRLRTGETSVTQRVLVTR